jgi:rhodanese-related sulfurtransferase
MQRWVKSKGKLAEDADMMVTPMIGSPYLVWPAVHSYLKRKRLQTISTQEAYNLVNKGKAVLLDVREERYFNRQHAEGAINVGLFREVQGRSTLENIKRIAMAGLAMTATERNPNFREEALQTLPKNKTIITMCGLGGTLETKTKPRELSGKVFDKDPDRAFGRESRSLKACYELFEAGFKNVLHMDGGFPQWRYDGFSTEP